MLPTRFRQYTGSFDCGTQQICSICSYGMTAQDVTLVCGRCSLQVHKACEEMYGDRDQEGGNNSYICQGCFAIHDDKLCLGEHTDFAQLLLSAAEALDTGFANESTCEVPSRSKGTSAKKRRRRRSNQENIQETPNSESDAGYRQQKALFYSHLNGYLKSINCAIVRPPTLAGMELDLFQLYREVIERGGCDQVILQEGSWTQIFRRLKNYKPTVTDASFRLKQYYHKYLYSYEQRFFHQQPSSTTHPHPTARKDPTLQSPMC